MTDLEPISPPCGRTECGKRLLCCRPDCPLLTVDIEPGLRRIYTRQEFVIALREAARQMGIDPDAIRKYAREDIAAAFNERMDNV
ncbi:MAG: hypothetical protein KGL39_44890 [Patescibacteria group bacterium]|nr:hypothetical protein [Patescibacteria group bacterium]